MKEAEEEEEQLEEVAILIQPPIKIRTATSWIRIRILPPLPLKSIKKMQKIHLL